MKVLLAGGAGYIGSHIAVELATAGHESVIVDNLVNSSEEAVRRTSQITGTDIPFYKVDVRDAEGLSAVFQEHQIDAVVHLAGLKAVGESVAKPLDYYENNMDSTFTLLRVMKEFGVTKLVFSSSATVYGDPSELPLTEASSTGVGVTNPYGRTKYMLEEVLKDVAVSDDSWEIVLLRYFNPVGAHESGLIGENPNGLPNNLMPFVAKVAVGELAEVGVFGDDYDTPDGSGVRDYIHVVDLSAGHVAALEHAKPGVAVYNLATGTGVSVLELIKAYGDAAGKPIPYAIKPRRPGDIASCYASPAKAEQELGWTATRGIEEACADSFRFQSRNPSGN
jgi:UDP-glucose 4-epimerase